MGGVRARDAHQVAAHDLDRKTVTQHPAPEGRDRGEVLPELHVCRVEEELERPAVPVGDGEIDLDVVRAERHP